MRFPGRRWTTLLGGALSLACAATARSQFSSQTTGTANPTFRPGGLREGLTTTTLNAKPDSELGGEGTTDSSLVRDAAAAQESFFRSFQNGIVRIPKLGYGQGQLRVAAPLGPTSGIPLFGFAGKPQDAEIKLGNFYLDLFSLSGSVLWSDNINFVEVGKESEEIAVVRLQATAMYQLNEVMRLSASGTAVWLPFKPDIGFTEPLAGSTTACWTASCRGSASRGRTAWAAPASRRCASTCTPSGSSPPSSTSTSSATRTARWIAMWRTSSR